MVKLNRYFEDFSKHVGIPIIEDRNGQIVSITTLKKKYVPELEGSALQEQPRQDPERKSDSDIEKGPKDGPPPDTGMLKTSDQRYLQQKSRPLSRFRFIIFLQCVNDIPVRQLRTHPPDSYCVEIVVLDQVLRYKIEPDFLQIQPEEPRFCRIDMNRFSVKYFFSKKRQSLRQYINEAKV